MRQGLSISLWVRKPVIFLIFYIEHTDRIARVTFEPWDILSAESSSRGRKKKNEKQVNKRSRSTRSNSSTSTSSVSSLKRRRRLSVSSVASDPVGQSPRKPKKVTKSKSGSVESRLSTKSTGSLERKRDISSKPNETAKSASSTAQKVKYYYNHKRASKRPRTASTEIVNRQENADYFHFSVFLSVQVYYILIICHIVL